MRFLVANGWRSKNLDSCLNSRLEMWCCVVYLEKNTPRYTTSEVKQMWGTLVVIYKGRSQVKSNKLSLLTCKYGLFSMEESKDIQCMFGCIQTIINELRSLGRTYDNYDHIDKILRSMSRKWRLQVTTLRALKSLDSMSHEELVSTLKVH